jgi:putative endonuclease
MKISLFNHCNKGQRAEDMACQHLQQQGLNLLHKNFHSRFGEIDLIMQHQQTLVFVEVRYRKNRVFGGPAASITPAKQEKIRKTALFFMQKKGREFNARFDVLAICGNDLNKPQQLNIEWIKNAF